jgi:hypothetical protein
MGFFMNRAKRVRARALPAFQSAHLSINTIGFVTSSLLALFFMIPVMAQSPSLVSTNQNGDHTGNGTSNSPSVSGDGRFVAFQSSSSDLVPNDSNGREDVFVRDMQTGKTTLVSVNRFGTSSANHISGSPVISADGRFVAFGSNATDLVATPTSFGNVFVRDLVAGTTTLVSINRTGTAGGDHNSLSAAISDDGRFVVFVSLASDLVNIDTNDRTDVFVRDLVAATTTLVSMNSAGTGSGNRDSSTLSGGGVIAPQMSPDGRYVAFASFASNLVTISDTNDANDIFLRDVVAGTTTLISVNKTGTGSGSEHSNSPSMSADGRYVAFSSRSNNLLSNDTLTQTDVFLRDVQLGNTSLVSVNTTGISGSGDSHTPHLTPNGRFVAFASFANDLVAGLSDAGSVDVFVRDLQANSTNAISLNTSGVGTGNGDSSNPAISDDGRFVAFHSVATNLVSASDSVNTNDVFVRDIQVNSTRLSSSSNIGNSTGNSHSSFPVISSNGRLVVFTSSASNLAGVADTNNSTDIFAQDLGASLTALTLLTEDSSNRAIALDSVTFVRDPFPLTTTLNFSADHQTRIVLFAANVKSIADGSNPPISAFAEDSSGGVYSLPVEYALKVPNFDSITQIIVKLPAGLPETGDLLIKISVSGEVSNKVLIKMKAAGTP